MWKEAEQSGNALWVTEHNAKLEGVAERVVLHTADMRHLPWSLDGSKAGEGAQTCMRGPLVEDDDARGAFIDVMISIPR